MIPTAPTDVRLQRDGVHVRIFSLLPGETVPCAVFPDDDLTSRSFGLTSEAWTP